MTRFPSVLDSLDAYAERFGDPKLPVYRRLFERRPDFEGLFVMDTDGGVRGAMLEEAINCIVELAEGDAVRARFRLEAVELAHDGFTLSPSDIHLLFDVIAEVLKTGLDAGWSSQNQAEWTALLDQLRTLVQSGS